MPPNNAALPLPILIPFAVLSSLFLCRRCLLIFFCLVKHHLPSPSSIPPLALPSIIGLLEVHDTPCLRLRCAQSRSSSAASPLQASRWMPRADVPENKLNNSATTFQPKARAASTLHRQHSPRESRSRNQNPSRHVRSLAHRALSADEPC